MPRLAPEDIFQLIFDPETQALKAASAPGKASASEATLLEVRSALLAGPREQIELHKVVRDYDTDHCKAEFSEPKRTVLVVASEDTYWVDSAADDDDARDRLGTEGRRGLLPARIPLRFSSAELIPRMDFRSVEAEISHVHVTGM